MLAEMSPKTALPIISPLIQYGCLENSQILLRDLERNIAEWPVHWEKEIRNKFNLGKIRGLKSLLYFLSDYQILGWSDALHPVIANMPYSVSRSYGGVLSGESFLSFDEEKLLIGWLDDTADEVRVNHNISENQLLDFCIICICYEHALRPIQLARINLADLRIYTGDAGEPVVHFTAYRAKKRSGRDKMPFVRKIPRRWGPPFAEWLKRRRQEVGGAPLTSSVKAFPAPLAEIIRRIGVTAVWTPPCGTACR